MNRLLIFVLFLMMSACQHEASRVRCDSKLQPINAAAPIVKEPPTKSASKP
jgi:hypothetical protein